MKLRRNFLPKNVADWGGFLFLLLVVPVFYWFEMFIVVPDCYTSSSVWYWIHFVTGSFLMINIVSNFLAVMFIDTSIFSADVSKEETENWNFCHTCQLPVPPRCWHCDACNVCILKRDHHCTFSGCCVGYANHRFFFMFLTYFFIASVYALYFNLFYILTRITFELGVILQIFFPVMLMLLGVRKALNHVYMILLVLNVVGVLISGLLLRFHLHLVLRGSVSYEKNRYITKYDCGVRRNIYNIFGNRWYLTWISPFIDSPLNINGVHWDVETNTRKTKFY